MVGDERCTEGNRRDGYLPAGGMEVPLLRYPDAEGHAIVSMIALGPIGSSLKVAHLLCYGFFVGYALGEVVEVYAGACL